jgi:hypothetical protein
MVSIYFPLISAAVALLASYDVARSLLLGVAVLALQTTGSAALGIEWTFSGQLIRNAFGLLVGTVLLVELDQASLATLGRGIPLGMLVALGFLRVAWTSTRGSTALPQEDQFASPRVLILYLCAVFFSAGRQHHWLSLVAVSFVMLFLISGKRPLNSWIPISVALLALISLGSAIRMRPTYTPLVTEEQVFYELLSNSLSHFPASQPSYTTTSGINYHWLANGLTGWLNREIGFRPFILSSLVLPIVFGLMTVYLVAVLTCMGSRPLRSHIVVVVAAGLFGFRIYSGNSVGALNTFTSSQELLMMALSIGLLVMLSHDPPAKTMRSVMVCAVLAYGSVGAGASAVVTFVPGVLVFLLVRVLADRRYAARREALGLIISVIASAVLALWRFHGYPNPSFSGGARIGIFPLFGFVGQMVGDLDELPIYQQAPARTLYTLGVAAAPLAALVLPRIAEGLRRRSIVDYVLMSALVGVTVTQFGSFGINLRILTTASILAIWVLALEVVESSERFKFFLWPIAIAVLAWAVWYWLVATTGAGDVRSIQTRMFLTATPALLLITYLLGYEMATRFRDSRRSQRHESRRMLGRKAWHAAAATLLTFGCLQGIITSVEAYQYYQPRLSARVTVLNSSDETTAAAEWLASQPRDSLIAVDESNADIQLQHLVALSGRRFLLFGARLWNKNFLEDAGAAHKLQLQRQLSSPSQSLLQELSAEGVSYLVLRREISKQRITTLLGEPEYQNHVWSVHRLPGDSDTERSG